MAGGTIPPWLIGENLTTVQVYPIVDNGNDTFSELNAVSVTVSTKSIQLTRTNEQRDIGPVNRPYANNVNVRRGSGLLVECLTRTDGVNSLSLLFDGYDRGHWYFVLGDDAYDCYMTHGEHTTGVTDIGENTERLSMAQFDPGFVPIIHSVG